MENEDCLYIQNLHLLLKKICCHMNPEGLLSEIVSVFMLLKLYLKKMVLLQKERICMLRIILRKVYIRCIGLILLDLPMLTTKIIYIELLVISSKHGQQSRIFSARDKQRFFSLKL